MFGSTPGIGVMSRMLALLSLLVEVVNVAATVARLVFGSWVLLMLGVVSPEGLSRSRSATFVVEREGE